MRYNYLLYFFGILACVVAGTVAREAIINGNVVGDRSFPYFVSFSILGKDHICGGGIIDNEFILTAAHCLITANGELVGKPISVYADTDDLDAPRTVIEVEKVIVLKSFKRHGSSIFIDDIAVVKLKKSLDMEKNPFFMKLVLPTHRQNITNKITLIAGYGWHWIEIRDRKQYGGRNDSRLRFAEAQVLSNEECREQHPSLPNDKPYICARLKQYDDSKARGVCTGDGGGPLAYNARAIMGILSVTKFGCSEKNSSSIYTRISYYRHFIDNAMKNTPTKFMIVHEL